MSKTAKDSFLPTTREEMLERGWEACDIILISGEAYVDHPSFGVALLGRLLESRGYRVGIIPQPNWNSDGDFLALGAPRLFFGVTAGSLDSMIAHYTPNVKLRRDDPYTPGGKAGAKPPRATIIYTAKLRQLFKGVPIVIGGIEASLRRFAHYDYWDDAMRRSLLLDSKADILVFGMGERQIVAIADALRRGKKIFEISAVPGTAVRVKHPPKGDFVPLPSFEEVASDKNLYALSVKLYYEKHEHGFLQQHGDGLLQCNPPAAPLSTEEMDNLYSLPFTRKWHPRYDALGGVPALQMVEFSITSHRGCFGGCAFCSLFLHQGPVISSRSEASIIAEAERLVKMPKFKGIITDVGGPTANMYGASCKNPCDKKSCLFPKMCANLRPAQKKWLEILRKLRALPGVKAVLIGTGVRFDLMLAEDDEFWKELLANHVGGQLSVAPEHLSDNVLRHMRKPSGKFFAEFRERFEKIRREIGKEIYLVPYFISGHPGCEMQDMIALAEQMREWRMYPEQVQDFTPTPMTLATCMYYTGTDPFTGEEMKIAKRDSQEKLAQRAFLHYRDPENYRKVVEALKSCGRNDLIGGGFKCLVPSRPPQPKSGAPRRGPRNDKRRSK